MKTNPSLLILSLLLPVTVPLLAAPGDLDTTFGTGGRVTTAIGSGDDFGLSAVLQPDGKLVVAGYSTIGNQDFALVRYNTNGSLDTSFNGTGTVTTHFNGSDFGRSVALQPDGKLVAAGSAGYGGTGSSFALARYNPNGSLDTTFNGTGKVTTVINGDDYGQSVQVQNDGKLVVAGYSYVGGSYDFAMTRYNPDGSLDTTFNGTGKLTTSVGSHDDFGMCLAVQSDGKLVVTGGTHSSAGAYYDIVLVRYLSNGALDTSFNGTGKLITAIGSADDFGHSVICQPDGKLVVAADSYNGTNIDFALVRYHANGSLDTTFNTTGKVVMPVGTGSDAAYSVVLQPDGKLVVAGSAFLLGTDDFAVVRFNANGSLDTAFNSTGKVTTAFYQNDRGRFVLIQPDGRLVVAGYSLESSDYNFAIARYQGFTTTTTNQSGTVGTTNFLVAPTAGQAQIYNANADITASGFSSIGEAGVGVLNQSAGTHSAPNLYIGRTVGSAGTYNQAAGGVTVGAGGITIVGNEGLGTYDQTGGTHTAPRLSVGGGLNGNGTYRQRGGGLTVAGELKVGVEGQGHFEHSSGSVSASPLTIADIGTGRGSYFFSGGTLTTSLTLVGHTAAATFTQTGGTHTTTGSLLLGDTGSGTGTYNAEGGSVSGATLSVGEVGTGTLNINGGTLTFNLIKTGTGTKTIVFNKGTVNATSTNISTSGAGLDVGDGTNVAALNLGNGSHNITSGLRVRSAGTLSLAGSNLGGLPVALQGGTITGNGTVGTFTASNDSVIDLGGATASTLTTTGNLSLATGVTYKADLTSTGSDQFNVSGTTDLALANLTVTLRFAPAIGQIFTIVQNDGTDAISSPFFGLGEGAIMTLPNVGAGGGTYQARISYSGSSGNDVTLTIFTAPAVTRTAVSGLGGTSITLNGTVNPNAYATTAQFEYGLTTSYGSNANVTLSPNNGTADQNVSTSITGLTPGTLYHYRLTATNAAGAVSTTDGTFTTLSNNADLSGLSASAGPFTQPFGTQASTYFVMAPYSVASTTITPTVAAVGATVTVNGVAVASGSASAAISLVLGNNPWIEIVCTAPDGVTTRDYFVAVNRAYPAIGSQDVSFGSGGIVTHAHNGTEGNDLDMILQADGKAVLVTTSNFGGSTDNVLLMRRNSNGSADFTSNGTAVTQGIYATGLTADSSGRLLVGGSQGGDAVLLRYTASGVLDTTFDTDGKVVTDFGSASDEFIGVAVQSDGKIVVCGTSGGDFVIARYLSTGALDSTFGAAGKTTTHFGGNETANNIIILSDGKILVSGDCEPGGASGFAVARYLSNGTLDSGFGTAGKVLTSSIGGENGCACAMALQSDGKFIVGGREVNSNISFAMVRYLANGNVDTTFGSSGFVRTTFGPNSFTEGDDIVIQPDGRILIAGTATVGGFSCFALGRYNSNGTLDTTFDSDGLVSTNFNSTDAYISSVKLQSDGQIVAAGSVRGSDGHYSALVVRYNNIFAPTVITQAATDITTTTATLNSTVNANGNMVTPTFRISTDQVNWNEFGTSQPIISGSVPQSITASLTSLTPGTLYYFQAQAEVGNYGVTGTGQIMSFTTPAPEIAVEDAFGNSLVDGVSSIPFGTAIVGEGMDRRITIKNTGNADLLIGTIIHGPYIDGPQAARFTLLEALVSFAPITPGQSRSFTVRYTPLSDGPESAVLHIESNDADESSFDISLSATVMPLGEHWRLQYFGTTSNTGNAANDADPDHDGLSNLLERGCYLDPTLHSTLPVTVTRNGPNLEFTYSRSKAEADYGTQFQVQWSDTLQNGTWSSAGVLDGLVSQTSKVQQRKATIPISGSQKKFVRLSVTAP